jgi:hypothetical protein
MRKRWSRGADDRVLSSAGVSGSSTRQTTGRRWSVPRTVARAKTWIAETHSSGFELRRHFFLQLFESEFVSVPGQGKVVAGGALAMLLSIGVVFVQAYYHKYLALNELDDGGPFGMALLADALFIVTLTMAATGLFTTLQWPSLFPSLRDYLALAALPTRVRDMFIAKLTALLAVAALVTVATALPLSLLLRIVMEGPYAVNLSRQAPALFVSSSLAGLFGFFCLIVLQGVLLNVLPVRHFQRVSLAAQGLLLVVFLCGLLFILRIPGLPWMNLRPSWAVYAPPLWFLGLEQVMVGNPEPLAVRLAWTSVAGSVGSAVAALIAYWWSYRWQRTRVLESPAVEKNGRVYLPSAVSGYLLPNLRSLAVFGFIAKSLARSRQHRLILTGFAAVAVALIAEGFASMALGGRFDARTPVFREAAIAVPLTLSLCMLVGLRYLFRLPVELRANWIFRIHEPGHAMEFLAGVERFLFYCGAMPVAIATLPVEMSLLGPCPGVIASLICLLISLVLMEILLLTFEKVPFTSSYLPGKRPLVETVLRYSAILTLYIGILGAVVRGALAVPALSAALGVLLAATWWMARRVRLKTQRVERLEFEETPEKAVQQLLIERD